MYQTLYRTDSNVQDLFKNVLDREKQSEISGVLSMGIIHCALSVKKLIRKVDFTYLTTMGKVTTEDITKLVNSQVDTNVEFLVLSDNEINEYQSRSKDILFRFDDRILGANLAMLDVSSSINLRIDGKLCVKFTDDEEASLKLYELMAAYSYLCDNNKNISTLRDEIMSATWGKDESFQLNRSNLNMLNTWNKNFHLCDKLMSKVTKLFWITQEEYSLYLTLGLDNK